MMRATKEFLQSVMDKLSSLPALDSRAMFGGYGIYSGGFMFGLLADENSLYFKAGETNLADYQLYASHQFKPMPYWEVPADVFEDDALFLKWAERSVTQARLMASKKASKK
ncbi:MULTISPECIES: TfoX/Sxy family protein [Dehalococcoides]|jgi:DNA transformation protein|uniref:TfoX/Sxy family protein n=1 Tax=Dehalococcoides TaxID=61434 RepID=UPI0003C83EB5|nr:MULTISPECIES: TfoX/Sxy family protein [Dehalococcoides]AHB13848.1 TfoX domain-containing protein [Dehalococcoides mccartyi GY50]QYY58833.2 TfoX/Sxy family protein [Dehalococcoides mccartyi]